MVANSVAVPPLIVVVLLSALNTRSTSPLATVLTPLIALFRSVTSMVVPPVIVTALAPKLSKESVVNCAAFWAAVINVDKAEAVDDSIVITALASTACVVPALTVFSSAAVPAVSVTVTVNAAFALAARPVNVSKSPSLTVAVTVPPALAVISLASATVISTPPAPLFVTVTAWLAPETTNRLLVTSLMKSVTSLWLSRVTVVVSARLNVAIAGSILNPSNLLISESNVVKSIVSPETLIVAIVVVAAIVPAVIAAPRVFISLRELELIVCTLERDMFVTSVFSKLISEADWVEADGVNVKSDSTFAAEPIAPFKKLFKTELWIKWEVLEPVVSTISLITPVTVVRTDALISAAVALLMTFNCAAVAVAGGLIIKKLVEEGVRVASSELDSVSKIVAPRENVLLLVKRAVRSLAWSTVIEPKTLILSERLPFPGFALPPSGVKVPLR